MPIKLKIKKIYVTLCNVLDKSKIIYLHHPLQPFLQFGLIKLMHKESCSLRKCRGIINTFRLN